MLAGSRNDQRRWEKAIRDISAKGLIQAVTAPFKGRAVSEATARRMIDTRWRAPPKSRPHPLPAQLIVSLTSYPARFSTLAMTLKGLLRQTVQPDAVILWIAEDAFHQLPPDVLALQEHGLEIRQTREIGSYKKIIPALEAFPDATIVTADDDLFYSSHWLETLVQSALAHPGAIICHRAHRPRFSAAGTALPYHEWHLEVRKSSPDEVLFPTSGAGILFPPRSLHPEVLNEQSFMQLAPRADDIWLFFMARMARTKIIMAGPSMRLTTWRDSQTERLSSYNFGPQHGNDIQFRRMWDRYPIALQDAGALG